MDTSVFSCYQGNLTQQHLSPHSLIQFQVTHLQDHQDEDETAWFHSADPGRPVRRQAKSRSVCHHGGKKKFL